MSPKVKFYIMLIVLLFGGVLYRNYFEPLYSKNQALKLKVQQAEMRKGYLLKESDKYVSTRTKYNEALDKFKNNQKALFPGSNAAEILNGMQKHIVDYINGMGLEIVSYSQMPVEKNDNQTLCKFNVNIRCSGIHLLQLYNFAKSGEKLLAIERANINYMAYRDWNLNVSLVFTTLFFEEGRI